MEEETEAREGSDVPEPHCWWVTGLGQGPNSTDRHISDSTTWSLHRRLGSIHAGNEATLSNPKSTKPFLKAMLTVT